MNDTEIELKAIIGIIDEKDTNLEDVSRLLKGVLERLENPTENLSYDSMGKSIFACRDEIALAEIRKIDGDWVCTERSELIEGDEMVEIGRYINRLNKK